MRRAVELGVVDAQAGLAMWYMYGGGLPVGYKEAHRLARLSDEQGNANAMTHLGALLGNGWGAAKDANAAAMCHVGVFFSKGWGVARDDDEACKWYRQAAALGHEGAKDTCVSSTIGPRACTRRRARARPRPALLLR